MDYVCVKDCQLRIDGQITFLVRGEVVNMESLPKSHEHCFNGIGDKEYSVNFGKASEAELMKAKWKVSEASSYCEKHYDKKIEKQEGDKKSDIVDKILDARYRAVS